MTRHRTVVFWGAGATAKLGIRTTDQQTKFIGYLSSDDANAGQERLPERVKAALGAGRDHEPWVSALKDLLTILGDAVKRQDAPTTTITEPEFDAMRRHWHVSNTDCLRNRIVHLRTLYDWPALKAVFKACPGGHLPPKRSRLKLNDLFNVLDMHRQSGHGFSVPAGGFLTPQRVLGAHNALKMLLQAMFYIDWQHARLANAQDLQHHYHFAKAFGRRMQKQGLQLAIYGEFDSQRFYKGDISFASMNYDPVALWCQWVANRDLNRSAAVPHIGQPAAKLQIYHDLGHFVPGTRVKKKPDHWNPMNETAAQRLNEIDSGERIRLSKFLFPHGCLWWRECPSCGKLSSYCGDTWKVDSPTLLPPPPLRGFIKTGTDFRTRMECERCARKRGEVDQEALRRADTVQECEHCAWKRGEVDARACVHCKTLTYAHHTTTLMQSNFKEAPPPFVEEIQRDLRVLVQQADHVVLMGYSLPPDDVTYRAFFAARRRQKTEKIEKTEKAPKCTVVVLERTRAGWVLPADIPTVRKELANKDTGRTLEAACDLFGDCNVRFYGGGIPNVFLAGGQVSDTAIERLLDYWE